MKKVFLRACASALSFALLLSACFLATAASSAGYYTIESPYADVVWGKTGVYKGNLHAHSTYSDADDTLVDIVTEHYEQDFDFLAITDHATTGVEWNKTPDIAGLYVYQKILGNEQIHLTDEQYNGMITGTYPLESTGAARGKKMTCVVGGNELNGLTASKSHVNGFFLPEGTCNSNYGYENGFEYAVKLAASNGGYSHLNHLGDWLDSNTNIDAVYDEESLKLFRNILLEYPSCLGIEILNGNNNTTPYDRILWDNLLMETLPYGRTIVGFSNSDVHNVGMVDSTFSMFLMEDNTVENIKEAMISGCFFGISRKMHANNVIGPAEGFDYINKLLPIPMFTDLTVDGHKVNASAENSNYIQWIANGKVIFKQDITSADQVITLDLDAIEGSEDFMYIRAELFGDGGMCASQALIIDDGTEPLKYEKDNSPKAVFDRVIYALKSTRFFVYIQEIIKAIK